MKNLLFSALLSATLFGAASASANPTEDEARALFTRFIAAQNDHDANVVKSMLWGSPEMLLFSRGIETRGPVAVAERFSEYYLGTWHLEPDMAKFRTVVISANVVQILVPIVFTRGLPDTQPQSDTFLISQTYVKSSEGWRVATIFPVANTQISKPAQ